MLFSWHFYGNTIGRNKCFKWVPKVNYSLPSLYYKNQKSKHAEICPPKSSAEAHRREGIRGDCRRYPRTRVSPDFRCRLHHHRRAGCGSCCHAGSAPVAALGFRCPARRSESGWNAAAGGWGFQGSRLHGESRTACCGARPSGAAACRQTRSRAKWSGSSPAAPRSPNLRGSPVRKARPPICCYRGTIHAARVPSHEWCWECWWSATLRGRGARSAPPCNDWFPAACPRERKRLQVAVPRQEKMTINTKTTDKLNKVVGTNLYNVQRRHDFRFQEIGFSMMTSSTKVKLWSTCQSVSKGCRPEGALEVSIPLLPKNSRWDKVQGRLRAGRAGNWTDNHHALEPLSTATGCRQDVAFFWRPRARRRLGNTVTREKGQVCKMQREKERERRPFV